jgi:hypothetical protein
MMLLDYFQENQAQARENKLRVAHNDISSVGEDAVAQYDYRGESKQDQAAYENVARR